MKKIMGFLSLVFVLAVANASVLDTSDMLLMGYYQDRCLDGGIEDLSTVAEEYDTITESTPQYIEGQIKIIQNTGTQEYTMVNVRTRTDGWVVAWLPSTTEHILGDIPKWDTRTNSPVSTTTVENAIDRIITRAGHKSCTVEASPYNYSKNDVAYYSGFYQNATGLILTGSYDYYNAATEWFVTKHDVTTYNSALCYSAYPYSNNNHVQWNRTIDPNVTIASSITQILCTNTTTSMENNQKYRVYAYTYHTGYIKTAFISFYS